MTDSDLPAFLETYRGVLRVFPLRQSDGEARSQEAAYFRALRRFSVPDIAAGAEALIATTTRFPKPVEWATAIPKAPQIDLRIMRDAEAREYRRAELLHWADDPCSCLECQAAGVTHRFLRFVPDADPDTGRADRAYDPIAKRAVTPGRWIHGEPLRQWYAHRDAFTALEAKGGVKAMPRLSAPERATLRERQPGEDG